MDCVADTLMRGKISQMEKELDGVESMEDCIEGMIGRLSVARDLLGLEISRIYALGEVLRPLSETFTTMATTTARSMEVVKERGMRSEESSEMMMLQNMMGIRNVDDVQRVLKRGNILDAQLFQASIKFINDTMEETCLSPEYC
jgi:hypothetical protein